MITVTGFRYEKATDCYLQQGVKGRQVPYGAVGGSNGSFIMMGDPPKALLHFRADNVPDNVVDVYRLIKANTLRSRVTEKYVTDVLTQLINCKFDTMDQLLATIINNL